MNIDDWEFTQVREKKASKVVYWFADRAMELSVWLAMKAHPYSKVWSVHIPDDSEG